MSLILTEVSAAGIAMVADSAISYLNAKTRQIEAHQTDWLKLLKVDRIQAAVSYWGNVGAVAKTQDFDTWLIHRVKRGTYEDLPSLADYLVSELNEACADKPLPNEQCVGIHVAGYHPWDDGQKRPTFYHVHNGHGGIKIEQCFDQSTNPPTLTRTTGAWEGAPREVFRKHQDFPLANLTPQQNLQVLNAGYITRNGDYFPYLIIDSGMDAIRRTLNSIPGVSLPKEPTKLGPHLGYLATVMLTVINIYNCSSLARVIGGNVSALGIKPDGTFTSLPSRKSKFTALRSAKVAKLP
jgi:hypothetical protein